MSKSLLAFAFGIALFLLAGCGGGSPSIVLDLPDARIDSVTPRVYLANPAPGFHADTRVTFSFRTNGFFAANSQAGQSGHFGLGIRADISKLPTSVDGPGAVFGEGVIFGNVSSVPGGNPVFPSSQLESWCNGVGPNNYLLSGEGSSRPLVDGVLYTVVLTSRITATEKTLRYVISNSIGVVFDSGRVTDPNPYFDTSMNGIWIAWALVQPGDWSVDFTNIRAVFNE